MFIYIFVIVLCLCAAYAKNKMMDYYVLFLLLIFLCFGYMTGSDWRNYELAYNERSNEHFEIGYSLLQNCCRTLSIEFWFFHIGMKILVYLFLCRMINFFGVNLLLFWGLFLPEMGFYLFIDCPFRNLIALGIFCFAIPTLFGRKLWKYFLLVTFAVLFHSSAIILYPLYFINKFTACKSWHWCLLFIFANIFAYEIASIMVEISPELFSLSTLSEDRLSSYVLDENFISLSMNIGTMYRILFFIIFLSFRSQIECSHRYGKELFCLAMLFSIVYPFTISFKIFNRFSIYLLPFFLVVAIQVIKSVKKPFIKYNVLMVLLVWTFTRTYIEVTRDYRYVPYSNYLQYLVDESPTYRERSNYNYMNTPYEKD